MQDNHTKYIDGNQDNETLKRCYKKWETTSVERKENR